MKRNIQLKAKSKAWLKRGLILFLGLFLTLSLSPIGALLEEGKC